MSHALKFQAVFLVGLFLAYLLVNFLGGMLIGRVLLYANDGLVDLAVRIHGYIVNILAVICLVGGEYLHFKGWF